MNLSDIKLLAVCDSPTLTTGFAKVANNLLRRFPLKPEQIHVWAIGFDGNGYDKVPWKLFPAGNPWHDPRHLFNLITSIYYGRYTHVWMLQDLFHLSNEQFTKNLADACQARVIPEIGERQRTRTCCYFPVDAHWMPPEWLDILTRVDAAVAYTEFGKSVVLTADEARRKGSGGTRGKADETSAPLLPLPLIRVIPHGVDTAVYHPLTEDRAALRAKMWQVGGKPWVQPGDFVMLNVNTNQRRKDVTRSLEILAGLKARQLPVKLVMHMAEKDDTTISLTRIGEQLGLQLGVDWLHHGQFFERSACRSTMPEEELVKLYHAADLVLTTTHGEGWGLSITEALACGCPVALPGHTACAEIYSQVEARGMMGAMLLMQAAETAPVLPFDNGLLRPRVSLPYAVDLLADYVQFGGWKQRQRQPLRPAVAEWLSWDRIAGEMWRAIVG